MPADAGSRVRATVAAKRLPSSAVRVVRSDAVEHPGPRGVRRQGVGVEAHRQAPYFARWPAFAIRIGSSSVERRMPRPPARHQRSPKRSVSSRPHRGPCTRTGTGCQECAAICDGVAWSPVTATTPGSAAAIRSEDRVVHPFDRGDLRRAIAVLAGGVRVLHVDEEQVRVLSVLLEEAHLLGQVGGRAEDVEPEERRDASIHRVDGDGRGSEPGAFVEGGQRPLCVEPAQDQAVCGRLVREHTAHLLERGGDELGRGRRRRIEGPGVERRDAGRLRIRVGDPRIEVVLLGTPRAADVPSRGGTPRRDGRR